jgi:hypothetical protein
MPTTEKYYPALSDLISINKVPSALHFLKDGMNKLFEKTHYKDYNINRKTNRVESAPLNCPRETSVLSHEMLHCFGLRHSHQQLYKVVNEEYKNLKDQGQNIPTGMEPFIEVPEPFKYSYQSLKYVFILENENDVISQTQNVMGYSTQRLFTWKWQWQIMRKNI